MQSRTRRPLQSSPLKNQIQMNSVYDKIDREETPFFQKESTRQLDDPKVALFEQLTEKYLHRKLASSAVVMLSSLFCMTFIYQNMIFSYAGKQIKELDFKNYCC